LKPTPIPTTPPTGETTDTSSPEPATEPSGVPSIIPSTNPNTMPMDDTVKIYDNDGEFVYETAVLSGIRKIMDIAWIPNDYRVLIGAREGDIYLFDGDLNEDSKQLLINVNPCIQQERALLSITIHPRFNEFHGGEMSSKYNFVYAYWVHRGKDDNCNLIEDYFNIDEDGPYCVLSRFTLTESNKLENEKILIKTGNAGKMHNGGGMAFGSDGYLYLATGDTGFPSGNSFRSYHPSSNLDNLWGKILRIDGDGDGEVPDSNPYIGEPNAQRCGDQVINPGNGTRVCTEIFARGLRNPVSNTVLLYSTILLLFAFLLLIKTSYITISMIHLFSSKKIHLVHIRNEYKLCIRKS
jgi:glucose/arabinose dehydrogenase